VTKKGIASKIHAVKKLQVTLPGSKESVRVGRARRFEGTGADAHSPK